MPTTPPICAQFPPLEADLPILIRRRILTPSAVVALPVPALPLSAKVRAAQVRQWHGTALGAGAAIYLDHTDVPAIIARAVVEIDQLKDVFSLCRPDFALSQGSVA